MYLFLFSYTLDFHFCLFVGGGGGNQASHGWGWAGSGACGKIGRVHGGGEGYGIWSVTNKLKIKLKYLNQQIHDNFFCKIIF